TNPRDASTIHYQRSSHQKSARRLPRQTPWPLQTRRPWARPRQRGCSARARRSGLWLHDRRAQVVESCRFAILTACSPAVSSPGAARDGPAPAAQPPSPILQPPASVAEPPAPVVPPGPVVLLPVLFRD
ncbi:hypothetical protein IWZ03DRAFT_423038, partial [Phyllosticta citriasiana]